jgi:two-component system CheB/CheR fusion protein
VCPSKQSENDSDHEFEALLDFVRRNRGFDFTGYKRPSLIRRVQKRMQDVAVKTVADYIDYLEVHPNEYIDLFNTILINVTSFFRDKDAWDYLAGEVVPKIIAAKSKEEPIRVWSAGCASGEEPYSVAILLAEALGLEEAVRRVKIYATDVDEEALSQARRASYGESALEAVSPELRDKYFTLQGQQHLFKQDLRRTVIFGRHDLVQDAPIPRLDLMVCRNVLMYFNAETQSKVLARLYYALNPKGFLFLGKAEMLLTRSALFRPIELKHRVFAKVPAGERTAFSDAREALRAGQAVAAEAAAPLIDQFFQQSPDAALIVNNNGTIVLINERARSLFGLLKKDIGRQVKELELGYRPVELQRHIVRCALEKTQIASEKVVRTLTDGSKQCLRAQLWPLMQEKGVVHGIGIRFEDLTPAEKLLEDLQRNGVELETANEALESAREELETTNKELQSSNEELETTNEELQSTNEELETMNEELQSTNTELETTNQELRQLYDDLTSANTFLESILSNIESAVIVLDHNMNVVHWSDRAANLWGLRSDEVRGKDLKDLDIGLPVSDLTPALQQVLRREKQFTEVVLPATNRRGVHIRCAIKLAQRKGAAAEAAGAILLMDEQPEGTKKKR